MVTLNKEMIDVNAVLCYVIRRTFLRTIITSLAIVVLTFTGAVLLTSACCGGAADCCYYWSTYWWSASRCQDSPNACVLLFR